MHRTDTSGGAQRPTRRRILVVTPDVITAKLAGPAIRAWRIASALAADHDVVLASTSPLHAAPAAPFRVVDTVSTPGGELAGWCEIMVVQGFAWRFCPQLRQTDAVVVVDYYDVLHFETLELVKDQPPAQRTAAVRAAVEVLGEQAERGDLFMCSTARQRDLWLGHLAAYGRVNPATYGRDPMLGDLVIVVPFGTSDDPPAPTRRALRGVWPGVPEDAEILLWAGGIYDWFDPLTLIEAVARLAVRRPLLRLFFLGMRHPNPVAVESPTALAARRLAESKGLTGTAVIFNDDWVDYDDRVNFLLEADIGVSTHHDHLETEFSYRTRMLDYLWAGLPVLSTEGDELARVVASTGCGEVVPPADPDALAAAIERMLDDRRRLESAGAAARRAAAGMSWRTVLQPLVDFCADPRRAADRPPPPPPPAPPRPPLGPPALRKALRPLRRWARRAAQAARRDPGGRA